MINPGLKDSTGFYTFHNQIPIRMLDRIWISDPTTKPSKKTHVGWYGLGEKV